METNQTGLLDGKKEIAAFLNDASPRKLKRWIAAGMPVKIENGRWLSHRDPLETFFKDYVLK